MGPYLRRLFGDTKVAVHILVCVFAISAWVDVNGMWAQLPLLTENAPEGWSLPSYLTIISQVANIGPIVFLLVSYLAPQTKPKLEKITSFGIILFGMAVCLLMAFFWDRTSFIGGEEHSTAIMVLNFFLAIGDCTSSVSFYAFMAHLKSEYMASLFIGEGLSGLIPAMLALGQDVGQIKCNGTDRLSTKPNFSVQVYFIILAATMAVSAAAFLVLNFWGYCRSEIIHVKDDLLEDLLPVKRSSSVYGAVEIRGGGEGDYGDEGEPRSSKGTDYNEQNGHRRSLIYREREISLSELTIEVELPTSDIVSLEIPKKNELNNKQIEEIPMWKFFFLLFLIILINTTLTTFLLTVQTYSILPYGLQYYHLVTTLPLIANPVACVFALFFTTGRLSVIVVVTVLGEVCVAYIIYLAAMSPSPPLVGTTAGGALTVAIWVLVTLLLVYAKVCIAGVMRAQGRNALIWVGASTQFGSLLGAVAGFVLVTVYKLFAEAPYCTQ